MSRLEGEKIEVLLSEEKLQARIAELGVDIARDYRGKPLKLVGVLKGSFMFMADLARAIDLPLKMDFIGTSSKCTSRTSSRIAGDDATSLFLLLDPHSFFIAPTLVVIDVATSGSRSCTGNGLDHVRLSGSTALRRAMKSATPS